MKNVTISMDEDVLGWVRVEAAKRGESVSRFLAGLVAERKRQPAVASQRKQLDDFLALAPLPLSDEQGRLPTGRARYEPLLRRHERADLREGPVDAETDGGARVAAKSG